MFMSHNMTDYKDYCLIRIIINIIYVYAKMRMIGSHDGATEPNKVFFQRSSLATPSCGNRWKIHFTLAEMLNYKIIYESFICVIEMTSK